MLDERGPSPANEAAGRVTRSAAVDWQRLGLRISPTRPPIPGGGPQTIATLLDAVLAEDPNRPALIGRRGRLSYAELDAAVAGAAAVFASLDLSCGDRVAACLPNDLDIVIAFLASQRLGLIWVGVNRALAGSEKVYILADCGASLYITSEDLRTEIESQSQPLPELAQLLTVDSEDPARNWRALAARHGAELDPEVEIDPFAPCAIAYTSGTTGFPKGAVHSQHNLLLPGAVARATGNRPHPPRHGVVLPMTILNLMVLGPLCILQDGRCCVAMDRIDAAGVAAWVRDEEVGSFDAVPTLIHDLLTDPAVQPADLASLTEPTMGGGDTPPEISRLFRERFGGEVVVGYGMTEAPTAVTWTDAAEPPGPGLCGRPIPQVEIEIVGDDGATLPPGEVGEICVRPARAGAFEGVYTPMLGYWGQPEASDQVLRGERYHTGDLGYLAPDGNLHIRGRRNELILRGGANVYPAEVERVLLEHADVTAAAVFGVADDRLGERVVAALQLLDRNAPENRDEVIANVVAHARAHLARYKLPDQIRVVDEMPRNAMNKIIKPKLRSLFE